MSLIEEARKRIKILSRGTPQILKGPIISEIMEKGLIATAQARIRRVGGSSGKVAKIKTY